MKLVWLFVGAGGFIGGLAPTLFGKGESLGWSVLTGTIGGIIGIWLYKKLDLE